MCAAYFPQFIKTTAQQAAVTPNTIIVADDGAVSREKQAPGHTFRADRANLRSASDLPAPFRQQYGGGR